MSASSNDGDTESANSPRRRSCRINNQSRTQDPPTHSRHHPRRHTQRRHQHSPSMKDANESRSSSGSGSGSGGSSSSSGSGTGSCNESCSHRGHRNSRYYNHHPHHHSHDHVHGHGHGYAHFHQHPAPPGCKVPQIFANPALPHGHHLEHNHVAFANGYAYGHPNYPESHWAGLGERIARTTVIIRYEDEKKEYICRTDMIKKFLPNSRVMDVGREWMVCDHINFNDEAPQVTHLAALNMLFRTMQEADRTNHFDLFATSRYRLQHQPAHARTLERTLFILGGMGEILSWDLGLGSNDVILDQIEAFILELIEPARRLLPVLAVSSCVLAIAYMWRPDPKHSATLKTIWDNLTSFEKDEVKAMLGGEILRRRGMTFGRMLAELESFK